MKPHKWAKEIKAWADGAEIEYKYKNTKWEVCESPSWGIHDNHNYRIKPQSSGCLACVTCGQLVEQSELKEPQYLYVYADYGKTMISTYDGKDFMLSQINDQMAKLKYIGKIKLEVDNEN